MKSRFIVTYDIADPKRLRGVFRRMPGSGDHLQLSVFRCDLTGRQRESLQLDLCAIIKPSEDQVLFIDLGPSETGLAERITSLGRAYVEAPKGPIVL